MMRLAQKIVVLLVFWVLAVALGPKGATAREVQLLMALDISGSMKTTDPLRLLPKSAHIMVELLDEKDTLGILTFEDVTLTRLACGSLNPEQRRKGFQELTRLQPRGLYTDLYQALASGLKCFEQHGPAKEAKRALLLISDGQMDIDPLKGNSKAFVERVHQEIIPAYRKAAIPIYTVAFTEASDQAFLKSLAEQTGGRFLLIPAAKDIHQAFTRFYEDLKGPQTAPLVGNGFLIDSQVQEAIVVVTRSTQGKAVTLVSPKGEKINPAAKTAGVRWYSAPTFDMVTIPRPEPGNWTVSGHKAGEGKIILMTDLKLDCPHVPEEAGTDEALLAGALLKDKEKPVDAKEVLSPTLFTAELQAEGGKPLQLPLGPPPLEQRELWPAEARVAKFPPFATPGVWHLKIRAQGKTFQRERNFSIKVSIPWYKVKEISGDGATQVEYLLSPGREVAQMVGCFSIINPDGGVAGTFGQPLPGSGFRFSFPPELSGSYQLNAHLTGATASGRPLVLQPPPVNVNLAAGAAAKGQKKTDPTADMGPKKAAAASDPKIGQKSADGPASAATAAPVPRSRKWLWFVVLGVAGVAITLVTVAYTFRPKALSFLILKPTEKNISDDMSPEEQNLLLKAHVEKLLKEKAQLLKNLDEMREKIEKLTAAKEELEARLGQPSKEYQEKTKVIKELEQRLEQAESEAKSVQEEYMALYARSQQEKQTLKKG
jgi:Mg-chelatase subunit ChlD